MRKAGFALALSLVATTQATFLSSAAFAQPNPAGQAAVDNGPPAANEPKAADPEQNEKNSTKRTVGWTLIGVGTAVGIAGTIIDIVAANTGTVAGAGGSGQTDNSRTDLYFVGTTMIVAGFVTGIYGGALVWNANGGGNGDNKASPPPVDDGKADSATKAVTAKLSSAPAFTIPVLRGTF